MVDHATRETILKFHTPSGIACHYTVSMSDPRSREYICNMTSRESEYI